jgi:hypothetical protein
MDGKDAPDQSDRAGVYLNAAHEDLEKVLSHLRG